MPLCALRGGRRQILSNAKNLPPDWATILSITRLDDDTLGVLIKDGTIHPAASRSDIQRKIKQTKRLERHQQSADHGKFSAQVKPQEGQYSLIYASPPPPGDMSPEEIMDLEVEGLAVRHLAAQDAVCLMWCTPSILPRAIAALEAWGFAYQTHFIWDKQ